MRLCSSVNASRGRELLSQGVIRQLWRLPGTRTNIGIWSAADANALEEALASLPIRPYTEIEVTALRPCYTCHERRHCRDRVYHS